MGALLDPKNDVVFKMLLADSDNEDVLINLLSAILCPRVLRKLLSDPVTRTLGVEKIAQMTGLSIHIVQEHAEEK